MNQTPDAAVAAESEYSCFFAAAVQLSQLLTAASIPLLLLLLLQAYLSQ
jgi:hypothetical protein